MIWNLLFIICVIVCGALRPPRCPRNHCTGVRLNWGLFLLWRLLEQPFHGMVPLSGIWPGMDPWHYLISDQAAEYWTFPLQHYKYVKNWPQRKVNQLHLIKLQAEFIIMTLKQCTKKSLNYCLTFHTNSSFIFPRQSQGSVCYSLFSQQSRTDLPLNTAGCRGAALLSIQIVQLSWSPILHTQLKYNYSYCCTWKIAKVEQWQL